VIDAPVIDTAVAEDERTTLPRPPLTVLQVDPSLFTAPYDAALSDGLAANDVTPIWATRGIRDGEEDLLTAHTAHRLFYRLTDGPRRRTGAVWRALKGAEHLAGLRRVVRLAEKGGFDAVHIQWAPLPALDRRAIERIRRHVPVVMTVHDIVPFNGRPVSRLQRDGYEGVLAAADRLIVHTEAGREALVARGHATERIDVVPHGLLPLIPCLAEPRDADGRWRVLLFGRIQPYKGADLLIEALGLIPPDIRERLDVIVAGEAQMPLEPLRARAAMLRLGDAFTLRDGRLSEIEMAALLRSADAFVFPYSAIDASGVLHLVAELDRWLIASDLGAFRGVIGAGSGELVAPNDGAALAAAIIDSLGRRPRVRPATDVPDWTEIGARTRAVYEQAILEYWA
jgi:glycosyltransferase involved in cell wall biosynthesis